MLRYPSKEGVNGRGWERARVHLGTRSRGRCGNPSVPQSYSALYSVVIKAQVIIACALGCALRSRCEAPDSKA